MKILFDRTFLKSARLKGGIARDSKQIFQELKDEQQFNIDIFPASNLMFIYEFIAKGFSLFGISLDTKRECDVFYVSQVTNIYSSRAKINMVRIHDIFPVTNPSWYRKSSRVMFSRNLRRAINRHSFYLVNSISTKQQLIKLRGVKPEKIYVYPCTPLSLKVPECNNCEGCTTFPKIRKDQYNIMVGTIEPRKNYELLLTIYIENKINFPTVVIGRKGWKSKKTARLLKLTEGIIWIEDCCDGALLSLYKSARLFISLSKAEGFDIPASEAAQLGLPLALTDIPVHREFHPSATLIGASDVKVWVHELSKAETEIRRIEPSINSGKEFSESNTVTQIFKCLTVNDN